MNNILVVHGGGPTAVINASLYGAIQGAKESGAGIYAAKGGTGGLLNGNIMCLNNLVQSEIDLLPYSPGSAIGTSRDPLEEAEYVKMVDILKQHNINCVLMNGGNGTMDTCGKLYKFAQNHGIRVIGIPKTMDNDLESTDHSPGYGSYARYVAGSLRELSADVQGLPLHVVVVEILGRNAGWSVAASALAKSKYIDGAELIYFPEVAFSEEKFLDEVSTKLKQKKGFVIAVSEGLRDSLGKPIVKMAFKQGRSEYFGDVSAHLSGLITQRLNYKARNEKPGIIGRASSLWQSSVDRQEAIEVGLHAARAIVQGETGSMIALDRLSTVPYKCVTKSVPLKDVMLVERKFPTEYMNSDKNGVSQSFIDWCNPLIGEKLPEIISFK